MLVMLVTAAAGAKADGYITEVISLGAPKKDYKDMLKKYKNLGYTIVEQDLNDDAGGWFVYLAYKTSSDANPENGYITEIVASTKDTWSFTDGGRTYFKSQHNSKDDFNGDMNYKAGGCSIFIYYTKDRHGLSDYGGTKRVISELSTTKTTGDNNGATGPVCWKNSPSSYSGECEFNDGAGGKDIYVQMHFTTQTLQWKEKPTFASNLTFRGGPQHLVTKNPSNANYGTLEYKVNSGSWSSAVPTATNVGKYKVEARLNGSTYADNSTTVSETVTINPPVFKATELTGVFNQADKKVNLSWSGAAPHGYTNYKWVVYRDGVKLGAVNQNVRSYTDTGFTNEAKPVYTVYYVSNFWGEDTQRDDCKAMVEVDCKRTVPVDNLVVDRQEDRIVFTWTSTGYKKDFGNMFEIYVDKETAPIITITPTDMQTNFCWEHRTTDQHKNRVNGTDGDNYYTEEPLNVCDPHTYHIKGVIDDKVLNTQTVNNRSIGQGTLFYGLDASKGVYEGAVKLSWHVNLQGSEILKTYIIERRRAEQEDEAWETLTRLSSTDEFLFYTDDTALPGIFYDYRVTVEDKCDDGTIHHNGLSDTGFAKSSGTVTGRIAYGASGVAVKGVDVKMTIADTDVDNNNSGQFHSIYFNDSIGVVRWKYPSKTYIKEKLADGDFSTQFWMYPEELSNSRVMDFGNNVSLSMTSEGGLTFTEGLITIGSTDDWENFAKEVNSGNTSLSAIMVADVQLGSSATLIGNSDHRYSGTFDGNGHTLTVDINLDENYATPFRYVNNATIRNLRVAGSIVSSRSGAGGLIGYSQGVTSISNCIVSATINSTRNYSWHGGFVGDSYNNMTITNSLFNGKMIGTGTIGQMWAGFVSDANDSLSINNCLFAPEELKIDFSTNNATFCHLHFGTLDPNSNNYYTQALKLVQGTSAEGMDQNTLLAKLGSGWTVNNGNLEPKQTSNGSEIMTHRFEGIMLRKNKFNHVVLSRKADSLTVVVLTPDSINNPVIQKASLKLVRGLELEGVTQFEMGHFKGAIDEFRLWTKALTEDDILENYDHLLVGNERDLETYWTFDEGLRTQFFDYSREGTNFHKHHGKVTSNAQSSTVTPGALALRAKTDKDGNYVIQGIPFSGGGTTYSVTPSYGIHEFNPNKSIAFISDESLVHSKTDFEDVSSFPMEGYVYYAGTNIPVEGMQFKIDGELVTGNGELKQTDSNGYYSISVPIGKHYVEATLSGHTMVAGGRFPTEGTFDFDRAVTYDFADSTLVNFVGRVAGGERNDTLAVGFAQSNNNIGMTTITLALNNESFSFNCKDDHITSAASNRPWESDTTAIRSHSWTGTGDFEKYIYIRTDSLTGEFSVLLPPLKYKTKSIRVDNNDDIEFASLPEIDLSSVAKELADSLPQQTAKGDSVWVKYSYNTKKVWTYFAEPQVELWQVGGDGAFGEKEMKNYAVSSVEKVDIKDIWTRENGPVNYTYGFPVFARKEKYTFGVRGFEVYVNKDAGEAVRDIIPLNGLVLTVANEMSDEQAVVAQVTDSALTNLKAGDIYDLKYNQVRLDDEGTNEITFTTGMPSVKYPYTRQFSIEFERNGRTYTGPKVNGVVLGELTNGNNFVTEGPDHVDMVLRDPPGAKSRTTWKTGKSWTEIDYKTRGMYGSEGYHWDFVWGNDNTVSVGEGVQVVTRTTLTNTLVVGETAKWKWTKHNEKTYVYTEAENISTSTGSKYVGANGDLFIGKSHNWIIGTCRKLGFYREGDGVVLDLKEAVSINDSIKTDFVYSALEIKETMIPKLIATRNALLEPVTDSLTAVNSTYDSDKDVYLTWLKRDDPNYGQEGTYVWKPKKSGQSQDMVMHYNQSVLQWKARLSENERDKIEAAKDHDYYKENRSFDGGAAYTYSERRDTTKTATNEHSGSVGLVVENTHKMGFDAGGSLYKSDMIFKVEVGFQGGQVKGDSANNTKTYHEFEYEFNDGNPGTDFTVDIMRSPQGWSDVFLLRGGQSYNPYEDKEYAEYYEPEKKHVISYGTEQMEQPDISISTDGAIGAKSATLTDVPAGGTGQFTLHLTNNTTTNQDVPFAYQVRVKESSNQKGLEVLMDGVPANGRSVPIPAGGTVKKIITVRQTDQSVLDFENVEIMFASQYQPLDIFDKCKLSVHFKPSSSPVDLVVTESVFNNETFAANDSCLVMKLTNFDRQFTNLKNVGVQYRFEGSTAWTDLHTWVTDRADSTSTSFSMLPATGDLRLKLNMGSDLSYPEGQYEFRAFTTTPYGTELVHVYSDVITVVKDLTRPRQLTTPTPTNGILGYGDDIMVEFNEDIVPGYVTDKNVIVTAKLNSQQVVHDVAKQLGGEGEQRTVNPVYMNGDFTLEFWMKWSEAGTILRNGRDRFVLGVTDDGHFEVNIGTAQFISRDVLPKDEWTYVAVNYKESDMTMSALAQSGTSNLTLFKKAPVDSMAIASISYSDDNYIYLGNMKGAMHDLTIYNICRDLVDAAATKYQTKNGYVYGMTNHWAMDEGHGTVAADTRNTHDFIVNQQWLINNVNYALGMEHVQDGSAVEANIAAVNTFAEDSYAIELWHMGKASGAGTESVFETGSKDANRLKLYYDEDKNMVLAYGLKKQTVATTDVAPYGDWHHLALNVVRGQSAVFFVDGKRTAVIAEADMPALTGSRMKLGENSKGNIDELRIWRATLSEKRLLQNMYNTLDTADIYSRGLVAYYPFEKDSVVFGVQTKVFTLKDMALGNSGNDILANTVAQQTELQASVAPPLKNAIAESRLTATPTASDRKVVIRLRNTSGVTASELEGCQLNITLDKVHDMHGNQSEPIRWTAYVRKNTLLWMKDSVTIIKPYGEDYYFDVDIKNLGGNTEYYSLSNMRSWLEVVNLDGTPVETEGTVAPESQKTLRFWVKPLVAVGNYDITVGLQGNQEIMEPLRIVMKVRGEAPDWTVDPGKYENSMSIVGQVYVNSVLMSNSESRLAAFIDNECRGVAEIRPMRGAAYVAMSIYGTAQQNKNGTLVNLDNGKPITFRIWDASKGVVYANVNTTMDGSPVNITFDDSKTYGNFNSPVIFAKSNLMEQELKLKGGWNWISLGVEPKETKTDMVFKDLTPWNVHIKDRSTGIHYCNGTYWDGTLANIHANTMYKMEIKDSPKSRNMEMPSLLPVTGESVKAAETKVTLKKGWNWIAYIPTVSMTLDRSLAGANPQEGDQVKSQQGFAFYGPYGWEGNLDAMESGKGYLYYSVDETTKAFVYPAAPVASNKARAVETNRAPELTMFTPVNPENYPDNMSMVVKLVDDEETVSDAELGAFIDGECRGAATATNGLYYLLIAGEGYGKPMELQVAINSNVIPLVTDITFSSDANIGTPWEPYVIDLSNVLSGINEITVDDNDDDDWWTLQGFKIGRKPTQPGVYIHHGQKVTIKRAK